MDESFDLASAERNLLWLARELHAARLAAEDAGAAFELFKTEDQYVEAASAARIANSKAKQIDFTLRAAALEIFQRTGSKQIKYGIGIMESQKIDYPEAEAKAYCLARLPQALSLDAGIFEDLVLAMPEKERPVFVRNVRQVTVKVPKDLGAKIEEAGEVALLPTDGGRPE